MINHWPEEKRIKHRKEQKKYRLLHPDKTATAERKWKQKNKDKVKNYHKEYMRKWRELHSEEDKEFRRLYREGRKKRGLKYISLWAKNNPEKKRVQAYTQWLIKSGKINRPSLCQKCNKENKIEAHHKDYQKPLNIIWLCRACHQKRHKEIRNKKTNEVKP